MRLLLPLLIAALLAACSQPPVTGEAFYRLTVPPPVPSGTAPLDGTLEVNRPATSALLGQRALAMYHAGTPGMLELYHTQSWVDPPSVMIADQLADSLRAAGVARQVVMGDLRAHADYILSGRLKRFEQVVDGGPPKGAIELELSFTRTADNRLLFMRDYAEEAIAADASPAAAVAALDVAAGKLFGRVAADIAATR